MNGLGEAEDSLKQPDDNTRMMQECSPSNSGTGSSESDTLRLDTVTESVKPCTRISVQDDTVSDVSSLNSYSEQDDENNLPLSAAQIPSFVGANVDLQVAANNISMNENFQDESESSSNCSEGESEYETSYGSLTLQNDTPLDSKIIGSFESHEKTPVDKADNLMNDKVIREIKNISDYDDMHDSLSPTNSSSDESVEHTYNTATGTVSIRSIVSTDNLDRIEPAGDPNKHETPEDSASSFQDDDAEIMKMIIINDINEEKLGRMSENRTRSRKGYRNEDTSSSEEDAYDGTTDAKPVVKTRAIAARRRPRRQSESFSTDSSRPDEEDWVHVHDFRATKVRQRKSVKALPKSNWPQTEHQLDNESSSTSRHRPHSESSLTDSNNAKDSTIISQHSESDSSAIDKDLTVKPMKKVKRFKIPGLGIIKKIRNASSPSKSPKAEASTAEGKADKNAFVKSYKTLQKKLNPKDNVSKNKIDDKPLDPNFEFRPRSFQQSLENRVKRSVSMSDEALRPRRVAESRHPPLAKKFSTLTKESGRMLSQTLSLWNHQANQDFENVRYKVGQSSFYLSLLSDGDFPRPTSSRPRILSRNIYKIILHIMNNRHMKKK